MPKNILIKLLLASLLLVSTVFSAQTTLIISSEGDTLFCFPGAAARFLQKQPFKVRQLEKTVKIYEQAVVYKDSTHRADSIIIALQANTISNKEQSARLAKIQCDSDKATRDQEIRRQKKQKWLAIGAATLVLAMKLAADFRKN